ncbi:hypothetical protein YPPY71_0471 [Yersinia pestis PY-71]|nr:hypothetical protein YPPY48_0516 [Yersinia pestis PY-48]EIS81095.1 hypothetical protein YPPY71_0471 [Yersinia pestis PY-71]
MCDEFRRRQGLFPLILKSRNVFDAVGYHNRQVPTALTGDKIAIYWIFVMSSEK